MTTRPLSTEVDDAVAEFDRIVTEAQARRDRLERSTRRWYVAMSLVFGAWCGFAGYTLGASS